jgi:hypothetical protein
MTLEIAKKKMPFGGLLTTTTINWFIYIKRVYNVTLFHLLGERNIIIKFGQCNLRIFLGKELWLPVYIHSFFDNITFNF